MTNEREYFFDTVELISHVPDHPNLRIAIVVEVGERTISDIEKMKAPLMRHALGMRMSKLGEMASDRYDEWRAVQSSPPLGRRLNESHGPVRLDW